MNRSGILTINAGSTSLKFALYEPSALTKLGRGEVEFATGAARLEANVEGATKIERRLDGADAWVALAAVDTWIAKTFPQIHIIAIGHRVVHGGARFTAPVRLDEPTLQALEALDPLAPQHQPANLAAARELAARYPDAVAVACFDTAFHAGWSDRARRMALPRRFHDAGVRRYGFHGLSYEYLCGRLRELAPHASRLVLAHLGGGSSMCAARDGSSVDATMGFSVLDGLPMATRCGAIDPGAIFHLHRAHGLGFDEIEHVLYYESGLKGISGTSGDMRRLLADASAPAHEAVELYAYRCAGAIGAMTAALGGIDALVFSGGIGAYAARVRAMVTASLDFLGVTIDAGANAANASRISTQASKVPVFALPTDEELMIARHTRRLLDTN
ncbi:MAG TPA: acetate/propionate family kinase [Rudaea sp.]|nr:acetate/propionate family kinase [Rudaea sp.]